MRALNKLYILVLFSLALGLFCGEIPESFQLDDDTSNDCIEETHARESKIAEPVSGIQVPKQSNIPPIGRDFRNCATVPSAESAPLIGVDLLVMLSVQRK